MVLLQGKKEGFFTQEKGLKTAINLGQNFVSTNMTQKIASKLSFQKEDEKIILATLLTLFCFSSLLQSKKGRF